MIGAAFLLWHKKNWSKIFVAGGTYSVFMIAALWARVVNPAAASGRLQNELVFYTNKGWTLFWENYCDYQSLEFLFHAPQMLALQSLRGVAHINNLLWPFYLLGLVALMAAALAPGWLLRQLGRPATSSDQLHWRRVAIWMLFGVALAPFASAIFIAELYTARLTHLLMQVLMVAGLGCACVWYLLQRLPGRFAGVVFVGLLSLYLASQIANTAEGLSRNNVDLKMDLQHGLPEVMRYLARQPNVRSAAFPELLHQVYIYHLCFTPVHPSKLNYAELTPPLAEPGERWHYDEINQVGNYYFNQKLDGIAIAKTAILRHQVRDNDRIWFDLYERNGDWFVLRHEGR
jgi:xanthosine utilization system XapX-like protein